VYTVGVLPPEFSTGIAELLNRVPTSEHVTSQPIEQLVPTKNLLVDYYHCPENLIGFASPVRLEGQAGYFRLGSDTVCYGRVARGATSATPGGNLTDALEQVSFDEDGARLPFDPEELVENLRCERYCAQLGEAGRLSSRLVRNAYYLVRPVLGVAMRRHLQRMRLRGWEKISFPAWPVDATVERIHRKLLAVAMRARNLDRIPFIWFWPDGYSSCAILSHDVETAAGRDFCGSLMGLNESFGFYSSFQVVPEKRYKVPKSFLRGIEARGFEVNVHDLKHDGRLFEDRAEFLRRARQINMYGREFGAQGFRAAVLYRNADWFDAFEFSYDMSIPNVAHLDPQRGGCCTVMPYLIGNIVELPVTATQDYTLFNILSDYSIGLWKKQIELIRENFGLISIIVHPDYIRQQAGWDTYRALLTYLTEVRAEGNLWTPLPRDVADWWRQRSKMRLVNHGGEWRIEGAGSERARVAYAVLAGDDVEYRL
jgi:hypothetical protein